MVLFSGSLAPNLLDDDESDAKQADSDQEDDEDSDASSVFSEATTSSKKREIESAEDEPSNMQHKTSAGDYL